MKPIPSAPGYFACEAGHIWRNGTRRRPNTNGRGYLKIKLSVGNIQRDAYVHRLVCEAFHGPCPHGLQCRHLNGNRSDNRPENLDWSDKATNEADKIIHGTLSRGEAHSTTKLKETAIIEARRRAALGEQAEDIARSMGLPYRTLLSAIVGRTWKHVPNPVTLMKGAQRRQREAKAAGRKWVRKSQSVETLRPAANVLDMKIKRKG